MLQPMSRSYADSDPSINVRKHLEPLTATSSLTTKPFISKIDRLRITKNLSNSVLIRFSTPTPPSNKSTHTRLGPSSTALFRVLTEPSLPMVRLPQEKPIQCKEMWVRFYHSSRGLYQGWWNMSSILFQTQWRIYSSGSRCLWLNCTWRSWGIYLTQTKWIWKSDLTKKEVFLLKISPKNIFLHLMKFINSLKLQEIVVQLPVPTWTKDHPGLIWSLSWQLVKIILQIWVLKLVNCIWSIWQEARRYQRQGLKEKLLIRQKKLMQVWLLLEKLSILSRMENLPIFLTGKVNWPECFKNLWEAIQKPVWLLHVHRIPTT